MGITKKKTKVVAKKSAPEFLTPNKFAEHLDVPRSTIQFLVKSGVINSENRGGVRYVDVAKGVKEFAARKANAHAKQIEDEQTTLENAGSEILGEEKEAPKQKAVIVQGHMGAGPVSQLSEVNDEPVPTTGLTYQQARAHREAYEARNKELEFRRKRGELVDKREVEQRAFESGRLVRDALLGIPDRIAADLAAEKDVNVVHQKLTDAIFTALDSLVEAAPANEGKTVEQLNKEAETEDEPVAEKESDATSSTQEAPFNP